MGQVLHGGARTTEAVRRAIQGSRESLRALAKRHGVNQKTIAKWKRRTSVSDERTGPKDPHSTVLSLEDEAIIVAFRKHTLLALDDCLYALRATIPRLMRSSLHRCLQRHGISPLPDVEGGKLLDSWTSGRIKATEHRVLGPGQTRHSIPFFYEPRVDAVIAPLPLADAASFAPFSDGDHLWSAMTKFVEFRMLEGLRPPRGVAAA